MTDFLRWLITALASIAAVLIIFALATISIFAVGVLFMIILIISLVSYITGKNIYTTKFIVTSNERFSKKNHDQYTDKIVDVNASEDQNGKP